jgi:dihydroxyacetone kinase-like predicted kinase
MTENNLQLTEQYQQYVEGELRQVRIAARQTSINMLSIRLALVDKGVVTEEELKHYDETATQTIDALITKERDRMKALIMEQYGEEAAAQIEQAMEQAFK